MPPRPRDVGCAIKRITMYPSSQLERCQELLEANPLTMHPPREVTFMDALCDTSRPLGRVPVRPAAAGYPTRQFARLNAQSGAAPMRVVCVGERSLGFCGGLKKGWS